MGYIARCGAHRDFVVSKFLSVNSHEFQSKHATAEFHGASRALGGCAVYVSDKPGIHDFEILKKLVLPDGTILRARYAGRPTRDCLFEDPVMDGKSLLKIWNVNNLTGVIGVFNCQGAGSWSMKQMADGMHGLSSTPPIGLTDMYNSRRAVEAVTCSINSSESIIKQRGRGHGRCGVLKH